MGEAKKYSQSIGMHFIGIGIDSNKTIFVYFGNPVSPIWEIIGQNTSCCATIGQCALSCQSPSSPIQYNPRLDTYITCEGVLKTVQNQDSRRQESTERKLDCGFRVSATPRQKQRVANQDKLKIPGKSHSCKPSHPVPSLLGINRQLKAGDKHREQQLNNHCSKLFAYGDLLTLPDHFNKTNI